jgi:hypothetical protein
MHHLKVNDFILEAWQNIDTIPRDGRVVEVQDERGEIWLARWHGDRIVIDAPPPEQGPVKLLHWRLGATRNTATR